MLKVTDNSKALNRESLKNLDAYWRAANYLSVGQIYLYDNPLLDVRWCSRTSSACCWGIGARRPGKTLFTCI
jgi:phosphoketolase